MGDIRFNVPFLSGNERKYVLEAIESRQLAGNGPFTKRVQRFLEDRYDVPHVLLTHSCTAALEMSALLLDLVPGDEVIVPSYTFAVTASAFARTGATIVFAEVDPTTMNIDVADVAAKITERTRAIVPVHYGGIGASMEDLVALVGGRPIVLVEDAAQGLEAKIGDRYLGTLAPLGAFSFHETKNLHSGLGGALLVNDASYFDRAEDIWERGTDRAKLFKGLVDKYTWVEIGSSFYPSELQADFLLAQLEAIDANRIARERIYERYDQRLRPLEAEGELGLPTIPAGRTLNGHAFFVIFNGPEDADTVREGLLADGIHAYIGYVPLHSSPVGRRMGYAPDDLPVTEELAPRVLRLPLHNEMSVDDVDIVCDGIERILGGTHRV